MNTTFFILPIIIFGSFFSLLWQDEDPEHAKRAHQIMDMQTKRIVREFPVTCIGSGGGMMGGVKEVFRAFHIRGNYTDDEARKIIVYNVEKIIAAFRADKQLEKDVIDGPFSAKHITLDFFQVDNKGKRLPPPAITVFSICDGRVEFDIFNEEQGKPYLRADREPYEETLRRVRELEANS